MEDIRILEFGTYYSGPLLGTYLSNFGSNVTSIIRPPNTRGLQEEKDRIGNVYDKLKHNKKTMLLPTDENEKINLIKDTDVIIENFRPGTLEKLGLSFENCKKINKKIIYLSLPAFLPNDKEFEYIEKAFESIIMASAGVFTDMGLNRTLLGVKSSYSSLPMASVYASIFGLLALVSAIYGNRVGTHIQVPLASCLSEAMIHNSINFCKDPCYMNLRSRRIKSNNYPINKKTLETLFDPFFCSYKCGDGRLFYLVCPAHVQHQTKALILLDIYEEVLEKVSFKNAYSEYDCCGLGCGTISEHQAEEIKPLFKEAFLKRDSNDWEQIMGLNGVPGSVIRETHEWISNKHISESGLIKNGKLANLGWFQDTETVPIVDENEDKIYNLSGIKVIDLTNVIAGPTIGTMLARFGADVTKIDPPNPTYAPEISVFYGLATNIGKKSVLLDIRDQKGYETLKILLKNSDILLINCTQSCLERLKLTRNELRNINPRLILCHFDAWSGPNKNKGYLSDFIGYDDCVQAASGIMARFGGSIETPEEHAHIGTIDVIAGVAGAATAVVALIERKMKGRIHTVRSSLASVGQYLQLPFLYDKEREKLGSGITCIGEHMLNRCYETSDGNFILVSSFYKDDMNKIKRLEDVVGSKLSDTMFLTFTTHSVCELLNKNGISAFPLRNMNFVRNNHIVPCFDVNHSTYQFLHIQDHPIGSLYITAPVAMRVQGMKILNHSPKYGSDTVEVLKNIKKNNLLLHGVASCSWSKNYIPFMSPCHKCKQKGRRRFVLHCDHVLCSVCITCSEKNCPICGIEHELMYMKSRIDETRELYTKWRMGKHKGVKNIEYYNVPVKSNMRRCCSCPDSLCCAKNLSSE